MDQYFYNKKQNFKCSFLKKREYLYNLGVIKELPYDFEVGTISLTIIQNQ